MYQNYIFDLYGTLVDIHTNEQKRYLWEKMALYMRLQGANYTAGELKKAYHAQIAALREGTILSEEIEVSFEKLIPALYRAKGVQVSLNQVSDWAIAFRTLSLEHLSLYEGAADLLKRLRERGKKVFLLSNAQRLFTEPEMRALGIYDCFDAVYYSSDIGFVKPSRHFYQSLLLKQGLRPQDSVMVGNDDRADAWGAHNNSLDSIYIYTRQSPKASGPLPANCRIIHDISEVYRD